MGDSRPNFTVRGTRTHTHIHTQRNIQCSANDAASESFLTDKTCCVMDELITELTPCSRR